MDFCVTTNAAANLVCMMPEANVALPYGMAAELILMQLLPSVLAIELH